MKYVYKMDLCNDYFGVNPYDLKPGKTVLVYERIDTLTGKGYFGISTVFAENGYPGISDSSIKCFHGWRGSYNNVATYAHGVYIIKSVEHFTDRENGFWDGVKITIGKKDIAKGKE